MGDIEHFGDDVETTLQFFLSCRGGHEVTTFAAFIDLDAPDIDLLAGEYERVSGRAALEVAGTTLLTGARLRHDGECRWRIAKSSGNGRLE